MLLVKHKKAIILAIFVALLFLTFCGLSRWFEFDDNCINSRTQPWEVKVENIERIFFHENFRFIYLVRKENGDIEPVSLTYFHEQKSKLTYYDDVPAGKLMWALIKGKGNPKDGIIADIKIHMHSVKDIEGGGWNHGKFGSGNTTVVE